MSDTTPEQSSEAQKPAKPRVCSSCGTGAKYTCPGCGARSCSLPCVRSHKEATSCTGLRDRTKMVLKEDMDNLTLLSDYRLLEEIDNKLEDNLRNPLCRSAKRNLQERPSLPPFLQRLRSEAWHRGTTLRFLPNFFSSHRENTTRYHFKERIIRWRIEWVFHQADVTFVDSSVDENTHVNKLLAKYLNPTNELSPEDNEKLAYYHSASYNGVCVLMKTEAPGTGVVFEELVTSKSLRLNFANKVIIEYPVLYVVLKHHLDSYLEYQSEGHDDLFSEIEGKDAQKMEGLKFFDADSDMEEE